MAKVLIDIQDNDYTFIKATGIIKRSSDVRIARAIANGTVLPKGHGRLIDADALDKDFEKCNCRCDCVFPVCPVYNQKTIIEADREVQDEK